MIFSSMIYITLPSIVIDLEMFISSFQLMILRFYLIFSKVDLINLFDLASSIVSLFFLPLDFYEPMLFHSFCNYACWIPPWYIFQILCYVLLLNELARELSSLKSIQNFSSRISYLLIWNPVSSIYSCLHLFSLAEVDMVVPV